MSANEYQLVPKEVPRVETRYRRIVTPLPAPATLPVLETLYRYEPVAMRGQPPVLWDRAEGFQVYDPCGNCWLDWSSGVLIANAGHANPDIVDAVVAQAQHRMLASYAFPNEARARFVERFAGLLPPEHRKVFLVTTGSEATECCIKLCRAHGLKAGGRNKNVVVSFDKSFHGRTLGAQQAGGIPALKEWIGHLDPAFVQVPFPDGFRTEDTSFDYFLQCLNERGVEPGNIAGVMLETYQGASGAFAPVKYMHSLRQWTAAHKILLVCDEVQAGFGRTGTLWGFEHYGIVPDLTAWGKGISSSLPLAAVAGRPDVLDLFPPGSMSSTHSGSPLCAAAALASLEFVLRENLPARAAHLGGVLQQRLQVLKTRFPQIGFTAGKGLVLGVHCVKPPGKEPDGALAWRVVARAFEKGLLMFVPVGFGGATVKINPPLVITEEALREGLDVFEEAFAEAVAGV